MSDRQSISRNQERITNIKDNKSHAFESTGIEQAENDTWQLDNAMLDAPGRPWTMTITDAATRMIVTSRVAKDLTPSAVSNIVAEDCREFGVPDCLLVDNGREFMSKEFLELTRSLNIALRVRPIAAP